MAAAAAARQKAFRLDWLAAALNLGTHINVPYHGVHTESVRLCLLHYTRWQTSVRNERKSLLLTVLVLVLLLLFVLLNDRGLLEQECTTCVLQCRYGKISPVCHLL
jgi:hypothetical protein